MSLAREAVAALRAAGATVATAESLTGGRLCASLVDVAGASQAVCGAIVAYTPAAKCDVLGVDEATIAEFGTVAAQTAMSMADRARERFGSDYALSTTGVAGPDRSEGKPAGTVFIALAGPESTIFEPLHLDGDRDTIRNQTVERCLSLLLDRLREDNSQPHGYINR